MTIGPIFVDFYQITWDIMGQHFNTDKFLDDALVFFVS